MVLDPTIRERPACSLSQENLFKLVGRRKLQKVGKSRGRPEEAARNKCIASSNKCLTSSNKCHATSNKKLLETMLNSTSLYALGCIDASARRMT